ncbi:MAG: serpin family protein [Acidobacteriota bacterium]
MRRTALILVAIGGLVLGMKPAAGPGRTPAEKSLPSAQAGFGFRLFSQITAAERAKNVFISPAGVAFALAMTWNGAAGETREAMSRALELQGMNLEQVNQASLELKETLQQADPAVQLQIANSLWARQGLNFEPDFIDRNRRFFKAEVAVLDFADPGAPARINDWVGRNTAGKIQKIVDRIDSNSILFLLNAVYFKGKWTAQFKKELTAQRPFIPAAGNRIQVPMMTQSGSFQYCETPDFQAISLPYGNRRWNMRIFLPKPGHSLPQFLESLTVSNWDTWMRSFRKREGEISLPRFRIEYEKELNDPLKALGMALAFDTERADFSAMIQTSERAYINKVKHKTFVEVNEEGTEAAAATSVGVSVTSFEPPQERFRMVVDRPFFCAIRDDQTGALLFLGAINDPR